MLNPAVELNLYRGRKLQLIDKTLTWSVTVGRILVILTELVALLAFAYRFTLDRQIGDLKDQTQQKSVLVSAMAANEQTYRNVQERLLLISSANQINTQMQTRLATVLHSFPTDMTLNNISQTTSSIRVDAQFTQLDSVTQFVNSLRNDPNTLSLSVDKIDNRTSLGIINLVVTVNQKPVRPLL